MGLLRDSELERIYGRSRGPVAFCDESHRVGRAGTVGFYTITAVLYERDQLQAAREDLARVSGGRPWHTTEEFEAGRDERIHQMLEVVAGHSEWGIVSAEAPIDGHDARAYAGARRICLSSAA